MELRYAGLLSFIFIVSFLISGGATRPLAGSVTDFSSFTSTSVTTMADPTSKVNDQGSVSIHAGSEISNDEVSVPDLDLQGSGLSHEVRKLVATTQDYDDPVSNENPKHNP